MKRLRLLFCVGILLCLSLPIRAQDTYVSQDVYIDVGKKAYLRIPQELLSSESRRNSHDFDWSTDFPDYRVVYVSGGGSTDSWAEVMVQKKFDGVVPFYVEYKYEEYNYVWERWDERSGGYYCFK